uniref:Uncharacterized protein n=1 Tax=Eucampia antarctica TaxID=49252 RepID=A0A7S2S978_9STRA|mmetsp:Transcript_4573/g.4339  ORF Transcript_4573/g.4339 Transcript_4573/m.4339 type:complete len:293 (+) Transcript_4573:194-1072(+)|eukprot:CAMPEP_0197836102 /NCGR_PEP_ID=MMETSP1437-20131217/27949_1 /TAXON_ID=49252 ORGANISM="Eucampia antarctica, Strain CCMP1452" /NCGR_SAMPLE_ID=MMETSP1437 /ASSEMBLY_ACC=CAM_ASM_001096 /LENGTH=292 /DNA_ID=CAMNT_0043442013 /DNA_START=173 /DNA_END=1051 /DNA_ORIENTATION=+
MRNCSVAIASVLSIFSAVSLHNVAAFAPSSSHVVGVAAGNTILPRSLLHAVKVKTDVGSNDDQKASYMPDGIIAQEPNNNRSELIAALAVAGPLLTFADPANAASNAVPSALFAYGHYICLFAIVSCVTAERLIVKPNMSEDEEKSLGYFDIGLGLTGTLLLVTGYYRAVDYGKGWEFYSHEPIFWLKMAGVGIFGGLSLFPTITIIKRTVALNTGKELPPMSEKLASRMKSVLNAELSALAVIPLTATLMSRAIGHVNDFPTQIVGPGGAVVLTGAAVYKYVSEALAWEEE